MQSFDAAKELCEYSAVLLEMRLISPAEQRAGDVNELHSALDGSYANAPQQIDGEP